LPAISLVLRLLLLLPACRFCALRTSMHPATYTCAYLRNAWSPPLRMHCRRAAPAPAPTATALPAPPFCTTAAALSFLPLVFCCILLPPTHRLPQLVFATPPPATPPLPPPPPSYYPTVLPACLFLHHQIYCGVTLAAPHLFSFPGCGFPVPGHTHLHHPGFVFTAVFCCLHLTAFTLLLPHLLTPGSCLLHLCTPAYHLDLFLHWTHLPFFPTSLQFYSPTILPACLHAPFWVLLLFPLPGLPALPTYCRSSPHPHHALPAVSGSGTPLRLAHTVLPVCLHHTCLTTTTCSATCTATAPHLTPLPPPPHLPLLLHHLPAHLFFFF